MQGSSQGTCGSDRLGVGRCSGPPGTKRTTQHPPSTQHPSRLDGSDIHERGGGASSKRVRLPPSTQRPSGPDQERNHLPKTQPFAKNASIFQKRNHLPVHCLCEFRRQTGICTRQDPTISAPVRPEPTSKSISESISESTASESIPESAPPAPELSPPLPTPRGPPSRPARRSGSQGAARTAVLCAAGPLLPGRARRRRRRRRPPP